VSALKRLIAFDSTFGSCETLFGGSPLYPVLSKGLQAAVDIERKASSYSLWVTILSPTG
jgi:hypothetical protein